MRARRTIQGLAMGAPELTSAGRTALGNELWEKHRP